ncbi:hypothetical protein [Caulobacter sp. FWC2]|uniref:hypothetical protein n=1 Tax=Caulobacter sp. FWC2 TaxID=69664 RepID=UPI000C15FA9A|nr:hypothetical protein [Caulobacter sp. FWC2]PIB92552.1 hypothetical protein CSW62_13815 [Caulobacter sp. FWC2]
MRISGIDYAAVTTTRPAETAPSLGEVLGRVRPRRAWPFSSYRLYVGDEEVAHGVEADPGAASSPAHRINRAALRLPIFDATVIQLGDGDVPIETGATDGAPRQIHGIDANGFGVGHNAPGLG